ncbi:hypothetical protein [Acidovorax sp. NCPPB 3576]|uniref:hypothetical protein n=1 Tax=Acidovorax sp. NCPPB 3576 TaxID=2940488 RepID=UPI00234B7BBF|nr:hypothetical protein [Acidovorax sp. NCPPB 3576]WCM88176.1 hypothetical protein M5C98_23025 [Acidovorax sp. NCPPB 3576]
MLEVIITAILASGTTTGLVAVLAKTWFETRVKASIEHEYKKQFELFQRQLNQQQKIELVAELLGESLATPFGETVTREQRTKLNKLSLQASLWLPPELAIELSKLLQNQPDAKSPFHLVLIARRLLIADSSIGTEHVTIWGPDRETHPDLILHIVKR